MSNLKDRIKPNFLIVGTARSGTTSLYHWLRQHSEVFMPDFKEPSYFVHGYGISDLEKYLSLFEPGSGKRAIGEASIAYLAAPESPERIYKTVKDIKIIILLRNPVHRALSLYAWMVNEGYERINTFEQALAEEKKRFYDRSFRWNNPEYFWDYMYFRGGLYYEQVKRYMDTFGKKSVRVYLFDDLINRPAEVYMDVCRFLNISPEVIPDFTPQNQREHKPEMSPKVEAMLYEMYREDITRLGELIRRDLSHWLPDYRHTSQSGAPKAETDYQVIDADDNLANVKSIAHLNRYADYQVRFRGLKICCRDLLSFYMAAKDIFLHRIYDFEANNKHPVIIDAGGHIGLFTLFAKHKYPGSKVIVFEPDTKSRQLLRRNIVANGIGGVRIVEAGLYKHEGKISFSHDDSDGSSVFVGERDNSINVTCLSRYINSEIDVLKMNIEGAESDVIAEIEHKLPLIKKMLIEYHGFPEIGQNLHNLLSILHRAGFRYIIHDFDAETNPATKPPFRLEKETRFFLLIYAKNFLEVSR